MGGIEAALAEHAFEHLFIECLGWDRVRSTVPVEHRELSVQLTAIAQKRGFTVFLCPTHRTVLANRGLLRNVQRQLRRSHHEHILIHTCETPRKQVWQWATSIPNVRPILHREHPFFSNEPPPRLLERLRGLSINFNEEEQTNLTDVLDRVRTALLPDSELNLFAKRPRFAVESDRLALAMKNGAPFAFDQFIELHRPLVRHASKRLIRWFDMAPEDAEQTAMIGLIVAARRWEPERGYQFSTYAHHWLVHACERYGQQWGTWFHLPAHWFFPCYRLIFTRTQLIAWHGERGAEAHFDRELEAAGVLRSQWTLFCRSRQVELFSDVRADRRIIPDSAVEASVFDAVSLDELRHDIALSLKCLTPRQAEILRLRYGLDGREHTLEEIAEKLNVTRERVRQIQVKAEEKLQRHLEQTTLFDGCPASNDSTAEVETEEPTA